MNNEQDILDEFILPEPTPVTHTTASRFGAVVAIFSFIVGTILFIIGFLGSMQQIFLLGYFFVIGAFCFNLVVFFALLFIGKNAHEKSINRRAAVKMLINIPVAIFYFFLLLNYQV